MDKKMFLPGVMLLLSIKVFCQEYFPAHKKIFSKDSITSFSTQAVNGHTTHLLLPSKELLVIAFLSPDCPLCKNYSVKLEQLKKKYASRAGFVGIIPGSFDAPDVSEFQRKFVPSWKLFKDTSLLLTHYLEGTVTPEVIVINNNSGVLLYKGAIDDWVVSLGKTRSRISNSYLDTALNNFVNNKPAIPFTQPVGCLINDF
jgi:thiol-disulfide isomerase/thioredoxin